MQRRSLLAGGAGIAGFLGLGGAQMAAHAAKPSATPVGMVVEAVQMPAWKNVNGEKLPLSPGDAVTTQQEVETAADAGLVLRMPEGSLVRLGQKTKLSVPNFEVDETTGKTAVRSRLELLEGFFRFTTSTVAKAVGTREIDLKLRTATVGIRGTDFWSMTDAAHDATCLFEGKVALDTRDQGALALDKPTAFWARFFDKPVQPVGNATPDELNKFLGSTELKPGNGVAVSGGRFRVVAALVKGNPAGLVQRLRAAGYPAVVRAKGAAGTEVRINGFASREDAAAVLARIASVEGVEGRVALAA